MTTATINGHTYSDDDDPLTGMLNGGYRTRFIPALQDIVQVASDVAGDAADAATAVTDAESFAQDAEAYAATLMTEVDGHVTGNLTAGNCTGGVITNVGQSNTEAVLTLPVCSAGLNFIAIVGEVSSAAWKFKANTTDKVYLDGTAGADNASVGIATSTVGDFISFVAFKNGASYDWLAMSGTGTWAVI